MKASGRLTLQSGAPVQTADQTAKTTLYYAPYNGNTVSIYDGSIFQDRVFTSSDTDTVGLSLALDNNSGHTNYHEPVSLFDVFAYWTGSVCRLATGPKWTTLNVGSSSLRGTGANTTELELFRGVYTNKNTITLRYGNGSGDTASVAAYQATYLGTIFIKSDGSLAMPLHPAAASGGTENILCVWNYYNRVQVRVTNTDLTTGWSYASGTLRLMNNSDKNRIWWVDGMADRQVHAISTRSVGSDGTANSAYTNGVAFNDYTNLSGGILSQAAFAGTTNYGCISIGKKTGQPVFGLNYVQELEQSTAVSMGVFGNDFGGLELEYWM